MNRDRNSSRAFLLVTGLALVSTLAGCVSPRITTSFQPGADFARWRTYAWIPGAKGSGGDPRLESVNLDGLVRTAVEDELGARGFRLSDRGKPDFLVGYVAALENKMETTLVDDYAAYDVEGDWDSHAGAYAAWRSQESERATRVYQEGTLILNVVEGTSNRLVWRGTAVSTIERRESTGERETRVREAVRRMLSRFPPL